jgi:hypothetical protein
VVIVFLQRVVGHRQNEAHGSEDNARCCATGVPHQAALVRFDGNAPRGKELQRIKPAAARPHFPPAADFR